MMKKTVATSLILAGLALAGCGGATSEKLIESGNEAFAQQDYGTALTDYQQAAVENPELAEPIYNAANVQYRQGEFEQSNATLQVALANADESLAAEGYFNLGNTHFQSENFAEAVDAYTESLRLNPKDIDAKVNLELALQKLQQEQQDQEQSQDEQSQDEQSQDEQSQDEQSQDEQSQDEQSQDEQSQDEQNQDEQNQDEQNQDEQNQDEQNQDEQNQDEQSQDEQSQDEQGQGEQEQDQQEQEEEQESESEQQGDEEQEQPEQPQPGQTGGEPTDEEQEPTEMSLGELLDMEGLSEEQARQLLVAAAQGTETLQEYLQQMYVFPYSDVEQDW